jgi:hypothetical protein
VTLLSSEALGRLLKLNRQVQSAGGRLSLQNVHGLLDLFEVPGMQTLFDIRDKQDSPRELQEPVYRLQPPPGRLDAAAITALENLYEVWWNGK